MLSSRFKSCLCKYLRQFVKKLPHKETYNFQFLGCRTHVINCVFVTTNLNAKYSIWIVFSLHMKIQNLKMVFNLWTFLVTMNLFATFLRSSKTFIELLMIYSCNLHLTKLLLEISKMQMWLLKSNPLYRANQKKRETELIIDIEQKRMGNYPNKKFWWVFSRQTAFLRKLLF